MATQFPNPFGKVASDYRALRAKLPRQISVLAADHFKLNFRRQGFLQNGTLVPWAPRKVNRRFLRRGVTGKRSSKLLLSAAGRDDRGRAILIQTGQLRRGIQPRPSFDEARVVNEVPYALAHNEGVEGRLPARPFMSTTPDLLNDIEQHVFTEIDKLWK